MAHPYHHAVASVKKWGGAVEDYLPLHEWFDESKMIAADFRHRALRHHAEGIFLSEKIFGITITLTSGRVLPVRWVGEQHVREDLGFIPSFADWMRAIRPQRWMGTTRVRPTAEIEANDRRVFEPESQVKESAAMLSALADRQQSSKLTLSALAVTNDQADAREDFNIDGLFAMISGDPEMEQKGKPE